MESFSRDGNVLGCFPCRKTTYIIPRSVMSTTSNGNRGVMGTKAPCPDGSTGYLNCVLRSMSMAVNSTPKACMCRNSVSGAGIATGKMAMASRTGSTAPQIAFFSW